MQNVTRPEVGEAGLAAWSYLPVQRSFAHRMGAWLNDTSDPKRAALAADGIGFARGAGVTASTRRGVKGPEIFERPAGKRKLALIHFEWRCLEDRPVPLDVFTLHHANDGGRFGEWRRPEVWNVKGHGVGSGRRPGERKIVPSVCLKN